MTYKFVAGHDNTPAALDSTISQPWSPGVVPHKRSFGVDGSLYDQGEYTEWRWDFLRPADYNTLLTDLGLSASTLFARCTITTKLNDQTFADRNATVLAPLTDRDAQWNKGAWRNVVFRFVHLSETA